MSDKAPEYCLLWINHWSMCMTKGEWSGWMQAFGAVAAVCAAFLIPLWLERRVQRKAYLGHLLTVATDVRIADRLAGIYLGSRYTVPAYRVPLLGAQLALPALLAHGEFSTAQAAALVQWYVDAKSFNYSLDLAQQLVNEGRDSRTEIGRTKAKANHLLKEGKLSRFGEAILALRKAGLPEEFLTRIPTGIRVGHADDEYEETDT